METIGDFVSVNPENELQIEGHSCVKLADTYETPLFVVSENTLRANYREFSNAFESRYSGKVVVCVGMKANYGLAVRKIIAQEGGGGDAFGLGELYVALLAGTDPRKIVMNGPNKADKVLAAAIQSGIQINVDSLDELERIKQVAAGLGKVADVSLRMRMPLRELEGKMYVDPRYGPPGTDVSRWEREFKFGMEPPSVLQAVPQALVAPNVHLKGIMYHGGIPRRAGYFEEEIQEFMDYIVEIKDRFDWEPESINLGGGFVPRRYGQEEPPSIDKHATVITSVIENVCREHSFSVPDLFLEPGRWCVDSAVVYLTRVGNIKKDTVITDKTWIYVDGSISEMTDPFDPYSHYHHVIVANEAIAPLEQVADICGPLCNAEDILAAKRPVPKVTRGDLIAFLDMGAYNESFANQANAMPRSATVLVRESDVAVVRRRETVQDVLGREMIPFWLT